MDFYVQRMKKFCLLLLAVGLIAQVARAQDAATEERLNKLAGQIEDLQVASVQTQKQLTDLAKQIQEMRDAQGKANPTYATQDDVNKLAAKLQEIDQKRMDDNAKILKEIEKLGKMSVSPKIKPVASDTPPSGGGAEKGYEYTIQPGDTISGIAKACRDMGKNVSTEQILKANPNLDPKSLRPGQTIFIPAP